jgi:hypothetical protein
MLDPKTASAIAPEDHAPISWAPWLTARRLTFFVVAWLTLFAALTVFVSNPFRSEPAAGIEPSYATVMFLHGLLIGMVGLLALLVLQVFNICALHCRMWITGGVLFATILAAVGGLFDTKIPGAEVAMWIQIFSFFALDEILILLVYGLYSEWRKGTPITRSLTYVVAMLASVSMFMAAIFGHVAGWIMEFGENTPPFIAGFRSFAGFGSQGDFTTALVGSHSHDMAVAAMALTAMVVAQYLGYAKVSRTAYLVSRIGAGMIGLGVIVMSFIYAAGVVSQWAPPTLFVNGPSGIPGDDVITGVLVMGGGVVTLLALADLRTVVRRPVTLAAIWAFVLSFATVAVAGYSIEMNSGFFGAGDPQAAGAAHDAIFTWFHQDVGLFLLPTIVLVMLVVGLLVKQRDIAWIGWSAIAGTSILFLGGMLWVFVDSDLYGPAYWLSTLGLLVVGAAILGTLYDGVLRHQPNAIARRPHGVAL